MVPVVLPFGCSALATLKADSRAGGRLARKFWHAPSRHMAHLLIGALAKAHGPDDIPPLLADDPSDPFAINSDPFSVLNLACRAR